MQSLIAGGDTRWIERGAHDLMGSNPDAAASAAGMPRASSLYGTLPEQLADEDSFARQLSRILAVRKRCGIAAGQLLDVPDVSDPGLLVMVNRTAHGLTQITVLNFSTESIDADIYSSELEPDSTVVDAFDGQTVGVINVVHSVSVTLAGHEGRAFLLHPAEPAADAE